MALKQTSYQAAAANIVWTSGQDLDSLTDNEWTDLSDAIVNTTDQYVEVDIRVPLGSAAFTGTDSSLELYLVRSVDGTNYANWTGNVVTDEQQNNEFFVASATTTGATETQELTFSDILVPPGGYKYGFRNRTNVTLAASGNVPQWRPHSFKDE